MSHQIDTKQLHFAAYLKAHDVTFLGLQPSGAFRFTSERPESDWQIEHLNSCCRRVDRELIDLRKLLKG